MEDKGDTSSSILLKMIHYKKTLGAVNVFDQRMVVEPKEALKLKIRHGIDV